MTKKNMKRLLTYVCILYILLIVLSAVMAWRLPVSNVADNTTVDPYINSVCYWRYDGTLLNELYCNPEAAYSSARLLFYTLPSTVGFGFVVSISSLVSFIVGLLPILPLIFLGYVAVDRFKKKDS